jgi:hypothetical protein
MFLDWACLQDLLVVTFVMRENLLLCKIDTEEFDYCPKKVVNLLEKEVYR